MEVTELFCTDDRSEWREWLSRNFDTAKEIWFVFPTVGSGRKGVSYNDAVEEALCFGWIDGIAKRLDEDNHIRRFTPRLKDSPYSQMNIERLRWLDSHGMIHPDVRASLEGVLSKEFVFPEDIVGSIRKDETAWRNYQSFTEPYRRIRVAYIEAARNRPDEFEKRLKNFVDKCRKNRIIGGYGGIEKYYRNED